MKPPGRTLLEIFVEEELRRVDEIQQKTLEVLLLQNSLYTTMRSSPDPDFENQLIDPPYATLNWSINTGLTTPDGFTPEGAYIIPSGSVIARGGPCIQNFLVPDSTYLDHQMGFRTHLTPRAPR